MEMEMSDPRLSQPPSRRRVLELAVAGAVGGVIGLPLNTEAALAQVRESEGKDVPAKGRPKVVAFDVIETLFNLGPMGKRLAQAGLPEQALPVWFARLLRDAFALDATGVFKTFREVAASTLEVLMAEHGVRPKEEDVNNVLAGFGELPAHEDVKPAFKTLKDAGIRIVTLTNGSAQTTQKLLKKAGVGDMVERAISIDEVKHWKPRREVYLHAANVCGVQPQEVALVAAHAWDIQGANRAGLTTGWVSRAEKAFPQVMQPPDVKGDTLTAVVQQLSALH